MKESMEENFQKLDKRVYDALYNNDLDKIFHELSGISGPTLVSGVGGSSVVSDYASKVLNHKNKIITRSIEPRDIKYLNLAGYKNILACSYSGSNYGVELSFLNSLKHYLLSSKENNSGNIINLTYDVKDAEHSFISLAATIIPCAIMLTYYLGDKSYNYKILDSLEKYNFSFDTTCDNYEIFTGLDTSTASKFLESTMIEAGIAIPIIHDKYSYCHGRSTTSINYNNNAIYFNTFTEFDNLVLKELPKYYHEVIVINSSSSLYDEFNALIKSMYLTKYIAQSKNKDLSKVEYSPVVKKLYKYNGVI